MFWVMMWPSQPASSISRRAMWPAFGSGRFQRGDQLAEAACAGDALLPPALRVGGEALVVAQVGLAVLRPEAVRPAERGDAALRRDARADERDDMLRLGDEVGGSFDGLGLLVGGHVGAIIAKATTLE